MANVFFNRGTQAHLNNLAANKKVDGAFYLTTDTNRLYVGKNVGSEQAPDIQLVELNQSINIVATTGQLPTNTTTQDIGQFYYVSGANILCVYTGVTVENPSGWTQINPDTHLSSGSVAVGAGTQSNSAKVTTTVTDSQGTSVGGNFTIIGGTGIDITNSDSSNGTITITPDFSAIAAAANTTYTMATAAGAANSNSAKIQLNDNITTGEHATDGDSEIVLAGDGAITVSRDSTTGNIEISASTDSTTTASFSNAGVLSVDTIVGTGTHSAATVTPVIKFGGTDQDLLDSNGYKFISGEATLPVYTKKEVKDLVNSAINTADAMTYKGSVNETNASTKLVSTANVGDTYKASESFTYSSLTIRTGDLLVATGTDGAVTWEVIPSGDDQFIQGTATATSITITDNGETGGGQVAKMQLTAGNGISLSRSTASGTTSNVIIDQDASYTTATMSGGTGNVTQLGAGEDAAAGKVSTITYVTGFNVDAYGNVGGPSSNSITTQTLTLKDTHNLVTATTTNVATSNNTTTVTIGAQQSDGDSIVTSGFSLHSDNITISSSGTAITANFEWGEF